MSYVINTLPDGITEVRQDDRSLHERIESLQRELSLLMREPEAKDGHVFRNLFSAQQSLAAASIYSMSANTISQ